MEYKRRVSSLSKAAHMDSWRNSVLCAKEDSKFCFENVAGRSCNKTLLPVIGRGYWIAQAFYALIIRTRDVAALPFHFVLVSAEIIFA